MTVADHALLRLYIDDVQDGTEKFTETQIDAFIEEAEDDLHRAAANVWQIKAAAVHDYYLSQLDGSLLARQQIFDHCIAMSKFHETRSAGQIVSVAMDSGGGGTDTESSFEF